MRRRCSVCLTAVLPMQTVVARVRKKVGLELLDVVLDAIYLEADLQRTVCQFHFTIAISSSQSY